MIILTTSAAAQTLSVIPRSYPSTFTMDVRDDSTNVTVPYGVTTATASGNYLTFNNAFNPILVENHFYDIHLYADFNYWNTNYSFWNLYDEVWQTDANQKEDIYRDRIFCTDQDIDQLNDNDHYEINKDQYTQYNGYNNDYLVI